MSDENQTQEPAATGIDAEALQRSVEALERKNQELITELRQAKSKASKLPDGVNVDELLEFKRNYEQEQLESQGKYQEAREALEQQFREATAEKDKRIAELEARVRELEVLSPAATALADVVHDPDEKPALSGAHLGDAKGDGEGAAVLALGIKLAFDADHTRPPSFEIAVNVAVVSLLVRRRHK